MSKKGISSAWIWACSRSFVAFSFFRQSLAKWPGLLHTKQAFEVFPLNCFFLRNFHFFFLKVFFFFPAWYFFFPNFFLKWYLFFSVDRHKFSHSTLFASLFSCSCLWACYGPCQFRKEISSNCRAFPRQYAHVDKLLPRRLVVELFFGDSSCEEFYLPMVLS